MLSEEEKAAKNEKRLHMTEADYERIKVRADLKKMKEQIKQ